MRKLSPVKIAALSALCIAFSMVLWASFKVIKPVPDWRQGELVVILPPADSLDQQFDQRLAELFAAYLGVKLKPLALHPHQVRNALARHQAHFSAIGMRSNEIDAFLKFGTPYQTVRERIVCAEDSPLLDDELKTRKIVVVAGSAEDAALRADRKKVPILSWQVTTHKMPNDLLESVALGDLDCTVANEEQIATMRNFYPDMEAGLNIATPAQLAWSFPSDSDPELYEKMKTFFEQIREDGSLYRLLEQYYGHNDRIVPFDATAFLTKANTVLPHYRKLFEEAAALTGIDWQLLAAMAYRESRWDPLATSATRVRGMMMLTEDTADRMNVSNRLDARESIMAGARYLQLLKEQLPLRIDEPDRTWLALAAYNQGMGHLEDARMLAQRFGLNPDSWVDVQKVMPRLSKLDISTTTKHGFARGGEAVIYVETVRLYHDILKRLLRDEYKLLHTPDYQFFLDPHQAH
jgi:membrane-bound lytic murein transglycosylase F